MNCYHGGSTGSTAVRNQRPLGGTARRRGHVSLTTSWRTVLNSHLANFTPPCSHLTPTPPPPPPTHPREALVGGVHGAGVRPSLCYLAAIGKRTRSSAISWWMLKTLWTIEGDRWVLIELANSQAIRRGRMGRHHFVICSFSCVLLFKYFSLIKHPTLTQ